jgi:ABC-type ATPase involved in cell division
VNSKVVGDGFNNDKDWGDQLDAIQFTTRVFSKLNKVITEDFVLASLNTEQRDFIREQIKQAMLLYRIIPDKTTAENMFNTLVVESIMVAVLNRNVKENVLLNIIGGVKDEMLHEEMGGEEGQTVGGKLVSKGKEIIGG